MSDTKISNVNWFQFITPILVTICLFVLTNIYGDLNRLDSKVSKIDEKMFVHLTNDELHMPRSLAVTKAEFLVYQNMRDQQMSEIRKMSYDIKSLIEEHMLDARKKK